MHMYRFIHVYAIKTLLTLFNVMFLMLQFSVVNKTLCESCLNTI